MWCPSCVASRSAMVGSFCLSRLPQRLRRGGRARHSVRAAAFSLFFPESVWRRRRFWLCNRCSGVRRCRSCGRNRCNCLRPSIVRGGLWQHRAGWIDVPRCRWRNGCVRHHAGRRNRGICLRKRFCRRDRLGGFSYLRFTIYDLRCLEFAAVAQIGGVRIHGVFKNSHNRMGDAFYQAVKFWIVLIFKDRAFFDHF